MGRPRRVRAPQESLTGRRVRTLVQYLEHRPGEPFTTAWLTIESQLSRQACTIALETLRGAGLVEQGYDAGQQLTTWAWIGEAAQNAPARARPRVRPARDADEAEFRRQDQGALDE